jgi:hypothetical protein
MLYKGPLKWMKRFVTPKTLDRPHLSAFYFRDQNKTGVHRHLIQEYRARTAFADPAPLLGPGKAEFLTKKAK